MNMQALFLHQPLGSQLLLLREGLTMVAKTLWKHFYRHQEVCFPGHSKSVQDDEIKLEYSRLDESVNRFQSPCPKETNTGVI